MGPQELIQVNLQLPVGALESLARLTEQLRLLTASADRQENAGTRQMLEQGENRSFDPEQFRALRQEAEMAEIRAPLAAGQAVDQEPEMEAVKARVSDMAPEAAAVRPEMQDDVYTPADAGRKIEQNVEDPAQAGPPANETPADAEAAISDIQDSPSADTIWQDADTVMEEIPTVQAETHPAPAPEAVQMEPESQLPDYAPPSAQPGVSENIADPVNAGFTLAAGPDVPQSRWTAGTETLISSSAAPLTAEDVSLAFQRDERRYDNGFPLY